MLYMVAGYLIVWLASFVFIMTMVQRQRNLQREIETLKDASREPETPRTVVERPLQTSR